MGIIYLMSIIILLVLFVLIKKTEKKINILSFICISIVTLFCYNTFICYILTFFTIPIKLWLLALINLLISFCLGIYILKNKEIQKYTFNKIDIVYTCLILVVVLTVSYINFGFPFNVKYETSDPSVHYLTSVMFAESNALLAGVEDEQVYGNFNTRKTVSYVNSGLLMKCICKDLNPIECYNVFVCFGMLILFMTGVTFYASLTNFVKKKEHRLWAFIISLICMLGYPLNSFLFGFEYLSMGLLIICAILDLVYYYEKEIINIKYFIILMALLNFGLFSSYYMFVPFVYPALWIYFYMKNYQKTKKILTKDIAIMWLVTLLIPFILGYIYHLEPNIYKILMERDFNSSDVEYSAKTVVSGLASNGYIYINLYSNMLLLLPLPIYMFIKDIKNRNIKNNIFTYLLPIFTIMFIGILLIGHSLEKVSIYYLSKNYFALWIILLYCNYKALILLSEKSNDLARVLIIYYACLAIVYTILADVKMIDDAIKNNDESILSVMEIFGSNKTMLLEKKEQLNQEEIDILMYAKENLDYNSQIEVIADRKPYYWSYVLTRYINYEDILECIGYGQFKLNLKILLLEGKINKVDYMIYFNKSKRYKQLEDKLFENSEIIYQNSSGGILKYKK